MENLKITDNLLVAFMSELSKRNELRGKDLVLYFEDVDTTILDANQAYIGLVTETQTNRGITSNIEVIEVTSNNGKFEYKYVGTECATDDDVINRIRYLVADTHNLIRQYNTAKMQQDYQDRLRSTEVRERFMGDADVVRTVINPVGDYNE